MCDGKLTRPVTLIKLFSYSDLYPYARHGAVVRRRPLRSGSLRITIVAIERVVSIGYHSTNQMNDDVVDRTLHALADPTRRKILARLEKGESCVTDLAKPFDMSLNAVSKHIRVLERARLVRRRRVWREFRVRIDPSRLNDIANWMADQRARWLQCLDALDAMLTAEDTAASQQNQKKET